MDIRIIWRKQRSCSSGSQTSVSQWPEPHNTTTLALLQSISIPKYTITHLFIYHSLRMIINLFQPKWFMSSECLHTMRPCCTNLVTGNLARKFLWGTTHRSDTYRWSVISCAFSCDPEVHNNITITVNSFNFQSHEVLQHVIKLYVISSIHHPDINHTFDFYTILSRLSCILGTVL